MNRPLGLSSGEVATPADRGLVVIGAVAAAGVGMIAASGSSVAVGLTIAVLALAAVALLMSRFRVREMALWLLVSVAVLNFATVLYEPTHLLEQPVWMKVVKDIPVALVILLFALAPTDRLTDEQRRGVRALGWALGVWLLLMAANALVFESPVAGFLVSVRYYAVYPLVAIVIARAGLQPSEVIRVLRMLVVLGVLQGVVAMADFFGVFGDTFYANYVQLGGTIFPRAIGTLGSPNNLAIFLGLPLCALFAALEGGWWHGASARWGIVPRLRGSVFLAIVLVGFALAFSKSAAVAAGIALAAQSRHLRGRYRIALIVVLTAALGLLAVQGRAGTVTSARARIAATSSAFEQWTANPATLFFGSGFGGQVTLEGDDIVQQEVTDSMPLTLALESGLIGVALFGFLVWAAVRMLLTGRASRVGRTPVFGALFGYMVFFLALSPVLVNFRLFPAALFFWVVIGLAANLRGADPGPQGVEAHPPAATSRK